MESCGDKNTGSSIVVVFGRPGAGKSTISASAIKAFEEQKKGNNKSFVVNGLDLDVCVPEWMKINFSKGIYPTLEQRNEFAVECCKYVKSKLHEADATAGSHHATIISFSFVNSDLREIFRSNFPNAIWVLIDTSEEEATQRIQAREGHFYKGDTSQKSEELSQKSDDPTPDVDNNDWKFAIVDFEHTILNGKEPVEKNASKLVEIVEKLPVASV